MQRIGDQGAARTLIITAALDGSSCFVIPGRRRMVGRSRAGRRASLFFLEGDGLGLQAMPAICYSRQLSGHFGIAPASRMLPNHFIATGYVLRQCNRIAELVRIFDTFWGDGGMRLLLSFCLSAAVCFEGFEHGGLLGGRLDRAGRVVGLADYLAGGLGGGRAGREEASGAPCLLADALHEVVQLGGCLLRLLLRLFGSR